LSDAWLYFFSLLFSFPFPSLDNQLNTALFLSCLFCPTHFWSLYLLLVPPPPNCNISHFTHRPVLSPPGSSNTSVNFSEAAGCNILKDRIFMIHAIWKRVLYTKYLPNHSKYVLYLLQTFSEAFFTSAEQDKQKGHFKEIDDLFNQNVLQYDQTPF
jgi:hypothetical protein